MATTLPNMSLVRWDDTNDNFSHSVLANNFTLIDQHDHSDGNGVQIGAPGIANQSITTAKIQDGAVTDQQVSSSTPITDSKLASANNSVYRLVAAGSTVRATVATGSGTFFLGSGGGIVTPATATTSNVPVYWIDPDDFQVGGLTANLQTLVTIFTNSVAPGINFTIALNPISVDNASSTPGNIGYALASRVTNSYATINTPAPYSENEQASADYTFPVAGFYALSLNLSGTMAATSVAVISAQVRVHHI